MRRGDPVLQARHAFEGGVPAGFALARHVPLGRIDVIVAAGHQFGVIARRFQLPNERPPHVLRCRIAAVSTVDAQPADADAQARTGMRIVATALIAVGAARAHAVEDAHHAPAIPAAGQSGQ